MPIESTSRSLRHEPYWLALRFPEAWFECRCPEEERHDRPPAVLLDGSGRGSRVMAINHAAAGLGIEIGQSLAGARSRHRAHVSTDIAPLRCLAVEQRAVEDWLDEWGEWALAYTSRVSRPPPVQPGGESSAGLLLEIGGSAALFGGLETLVSRLLEALKPWHLVVRAAGAPHPRVAWALATAVDDEAPRLCHAREQLAAVSQLPLALVDWPSSWIDRFAELGLRRLGEVRRLPRDGLGMRTDPLLLADLDRLFAERDWPLADLVPPARYAREVSLWDPASQVDRLLLLARGPLVGLSDFLHRRQLAVADFVVWLTHEDRPSTRLEVATAEPGRDEPLWQEQLRLRLESAGGLAPVTRLRVEAEHFVTPRPGQGSLFADADERGRDERALFQRLQARLGRQAVSWVQDAPDLIPMRRSRLHPLSPHQDKSSRPRPTDPAGKSLLPGLSPGAFRPLWWLEKPRRPDAPVHRHGEIERVETGWWATAEESADYCAGELVGGRAVCLRRESAGGDWQVIGLDD
ncbi:DNA polymerase Y family protein [Guyparkeria sp. SCN-R1]|uniref:Y-family DNA polymerase n=1 Tax=Guyparkeria sp. SCN-R1 TaxID=2341113 RepID=UPI000F6482E3|nr:DNA polymerase Y family protein [Guyparkeria sp. SCN-R1]RRQ23427.1 DNA polymerase Y family protein [Guyparkeria sp. SCN-R1]